MTDRSSSLSAKNVSVMPVASCIINKITYVLDIAKYANTNAYMIQIHGYIRNKIIIDRPIDPRERTASRAADMMMMFPKNSSLTFDKI